MNSDCLFCKIIAGKIPSAKVYEDEHSFAFLDINPVNIGHTLVVPKAHAANLHETPDKDLARVIVIVKKLSTAIKQALSAHGITLVMNNDPASGQIIFHTHFHIVPRFSDDGFKHWHGARHYVEGEMEKVAEKIKEEL